MKEKVNDLVRLHKTMQEKLKTASYSDQILTLLPDKWTHTLFELNIKSKEVGGILANPVPKKGKTITTETLHLVTSVY